MEVPASIRPAAKDPIFRLLLEGGRRRRGIVFGVTSVLCILPLILARFEGTLVNPSLKLDALHDIGYINQFLILLPFCVLFFPFYFNDLQPSLQTLRERGVVTMTETEWSRFVSQANAVFSHWTIALIPAIVALAWTANGMRLFMLAGLNTWNSPAKGHPVTPAALAGVLPALLLYYLLPAFVSRVAGIYFVLRHFLSHNVAIQPFHPDGCGGLSPIGRLSLRISLLGVVAGVCSLLGIASVYLQYRRPLFSGENLAVIAGYVTGLSIIFFVPSLAARSGMLAAKRRTLQSISDRFNVALRGAMESLRPGQTDVGEKVMEIEALTKLYRLANDMPVFPFNSANVVRFFSSVLWPLALMIANWINDRL